jgi:hypothetical protein
VNLIPVSQTTHGQKKWKRVEDYRFAAKEPLTPIVLAEAVHVAAWMPIVFLEQRANYHAMAMMCPMPDHNLFVGPDGGWQGV